MKKQLEASETTLFEKARIVGARALQLAMGAPPLLKVPEGMTSPLKLAFLEYDKNVIPLSVIRSNTEEN